MYSCFSLLYKCFLFSATVMLLGWQEGNWVRNDGPPVPKSSLFTTWPRSIGCCLQVTMAEHLFVLTFELLFMSIDCSDVWPSYVTTGYWSLCCCRWSWLILRIIISVNRTSRVLTQRRHGNVVLVCCEILTNITYVWLFRAYWVK